MSETCPVCHSEVGPADASCPICGFKLLGATQSFEPIAVERGEQSHQATDSQRAVLRVVRGPQTGASYELAGDELTIGRKPQCSIFLNDMTVSRMHATLKRVGGSYVINDENSYNGIWVNNCNVQTKTLKPGDYIQIGTFCLLYEEED